MSKQEFEIGIKEHGGIPVQGPTDGTSCVVAGRLDLRTKNCINAKKWNVVHVRIDTFIDHRPFFINSIFIIQADWLSACLESHSLLDLNPRWMLYTTPESEEQFLETVDPFGDSFTDNCTATSLKWDICIACWVVLFVCLLACWVVCLLSCWRPPPPLLSLRVSQMRRQTFCHVENKKLLEKHCNLLSGVCFLLFYVCSEVNAHCPQDEIKELEDRYFPNQSLLGLFRRLRVYVDRYALVGDPETALTASELDIIACRVCIPFLLSQQSLTVLADWILWWYPHSWPSWSNACYHWPSELNAKRNTNFLWPYIC